MVLHFYCIYLIKKIAFVLLDIRKHLPTVGTIIEYDCYHLYRWRDFGSSGLQTTVLRNSTLVEIDNGFIVPYYSLPHFIGQWHHPLHASLMLFVDGISIDPLNTSTQLYRLSVVLSPFRWNDVHPKFVNLLMLKILLLNYGRCGKYSRHRSVIGINRYLSILNYWNLDIQYLT